MRPTVFTVPFLPRDTIKFMPAGCIHWPKTDKPLLKEWVEELARENAFGLLMGDTQDAMRTRARSHIKGYQADQSSLQALDDWARRDVADLAAILAPIKHKLAGAILGNHFWEFLDGTNSEQLLCKILEIPYLGPLGIIRVQFQRLTKAPTDTANRIAASIVIYAHHSGGTAGGRTSGGDVNALERQENLIDADVYCLSHTHRKYGTKQLITKVTSKGIPKLYTAQKAFLRTGAFLKRDLDEAISKERQHVAPYEDLAAYRQLEPGWVTLDISLRTRDVGTRSGFYGRTNMVIPEFKITY